MIAAPDDRRFAGHSIGGLRYSVDQSWAASRPVVRLEARLGIPVPSGLTPSEVLDCERFSLLVWGKTLFDYEPSHNGRHGYACPQCLAALEEQRRRQAEAARIAAIPQPWDVRMAA